MKKIQSALISVFNKSGIEIIANELIAQGIVIYSTGGTQSLLESLGIPCIPVENVTTYPSILGGRVKTLHPSIFGGILGRRNEVTDLEEMSNFNIPEIDLVIVDLYPFEDTVRNTTIEKDIIEKIDIGGPSMIRAAAKNFQDVLVIASKDEYSSLTHLIQEQQGGTSLTQRKSFAAKAFEIVMNYDIAISNYFNPTNTILPANKLQQSLRYGENPHQTAFFYGNTNEIFQHLHGRELSYNNLVDVDAAIQLISEFSISKDSIFAIIKHTNVCGIAQRDSLLDSWIAALSGDPESAFGGVLVCNKPINLETANAINEIFFEVLIAPSFESDALSILQSKKNRILLHLNGTENPEKNISKSILNGRLVQQIDEGNFDEWNELGGRKTTEIEKHNLIFANLIAKHLKSNAIALVKNLQLVGKGCGQTSRIDALRQAIQKAKQFQFDLSDAVLASDAFFPFNDCVQIAHEAGIQAFIQPGGSIRDKESIDYCVENNLAMVTTGRRHFKH